MVLPEANVLPFSISYHAFTRLVLGLMAIIFTDMMSAFFHPVLKQTVTMDIDSKLRGVTVISDK